MSRRNANRSMPRAGHGSNRKSANSQIYGAQHHHRSWRLVVFLILIAIGTLIVFAIGRNWQTDPHTPTAASQPATALSAALPQIPDPDLTGAEPQVVEVLHNARSAVLADPRSAKAWGIYGVTCDAHGLNVEAEICYHQACDLAPDDPRWTYLLAAKLQMMGGDSEHTLALLRHASQLMPEMPAVWRRIGEVYAGRGQLTEATAAFREATARFPTQAAAHRLLGQTLMQAGDADGAIAALQEADRLSPRDRSVTLSLSQAYWRKGDWARAEQFHAEAQNYGNTVRLVDPMLYQVMSMCVGVGKCREMADTLLADREFARALRALEIVVQAEPDDPLVHARLGLALLEVKDTESARQHLEQAITLDPQCMDAHAVLGMLHLNANQPDHAAPHFSLVLQKFPDNRAVRAMYAAALSRLGLIDDALAQFQRAAGQGPLDAAAEMEWAAACDRAGQTDQAIIHYQNALLLNASLIEAHYRLGMLLERIQRTTEAIEQYQKAAAIDPNHPAARRLATIQSPPAAP